jgi:hypothetical protein
MCITVQVTDNQEAADYKRGLSYLVTNIMHEVAAGEETTALL